MNKLLVGMAAIAGLFSNLNLDSSRGNSIYKEQPRNNLKHRMEAELKRKRKRAKAAAINPSPEK